MFCLFCFPLTNLIHCFSVFSSILEGALSYLSPWIATSSKNSISFRKWKLHHLRRVSIKLEGRRNGNVKIENLGREIQNTKVKMSFQMAAATDIKNIVTQRKYWCGGRLAGGRGTLWPLIEKFPDHCHWLLLPTLLSTKP